MIPVLASPRLALPCHAQPFRAEPSPADTDHRRYWRKTERVLDVMGGAYLLDDILTAIQSGKMQSFAHGNAWGVTEIIDSPRLRRLHILFVVGDLADIDGLQAKILDYADEINAGLISAIGRRGWLPHALKRGWKVKARSYLYQKDC